MNVNNCCFCQTLLQQLSRGDYDGLRCINCFTSVPTDHQLIYRCFNEQCFIKEMIGYQFGICSTCFDKSDTDFKVENTTYNVDFICDKIHNSLNIIS